MRNTPEEWPRIAPSVFYRDAAGAIDWLCRAFGFSVELKVEEGGHVVHSQLVLGGGLIMVGTAGDVTRRPGRELFVSPLSTRGANTQSLCIRVDDVDAHCERARAAGAVIASEPETQDYGAGYWVDRTYQAVDPEGHRWWFLQRLRDRRLAGP